MEQNVIEKVNKNEKIINKYKDTYVILAFLPVISLLIDALQLPKGTLL